VQVSAVEHGVNNPALDRFQPVANVGLARLGSRIWHRWHNGRPDFFERLLADISTGAGSMAIGFFLAWVISLMKGSFKVKSTFSQPIFDKEHLFSIRIDAALEPRRVLDLCGSMSGFLDPWSFL
jgi:hypothetical protein